MEAGLNHDDSDINYLHRITKIGKFFCFKFKPSLWQRGMIRELQRGNNMWTIEDIVHSAGKCTSVNAISRDDLLDLMDGYGWRNPIHLDNTQASQEAHNAADGNDWSLLSVAAEKGHEGMIRLLLQRGADPNGVGHQRHTPLLCASRGGYERIARLLLQHGASADGKEPRPDTPLFYASRSGHETMVRLLLRYEADPKRMVTCFPELAEAPQLPVAAWCVVELLLKHGPRAS